MLIEHYFTSDSHSYKFRKLRLKSENKVGGEGRGGDSCIRCTQAEFLSVQHYSKAKHVKISLIQEKIMFDNMDNFRAEIDKKEKN